MRLADTAIEPEEQARQAALMAQMQRDRTQALLGSVQLGVCNTERGCKASPAGNLDAFCPDDFRCLPKALRAELRDARDAWVRLPGGNAKANAYRAYAMRIIGARLWLKKEAKS